MKSWADVREMALAFPGVTEGTSYGTPAFHVGKAFLTRLHEDGESLVLKVGFDERELLMEAAPDVFHITPHYRAWPTVLVRYARAEPGEVRRLFEANWRARAPRRLVAAHDGNAAAPRA